MKEIIITSSVLILCIMLIRLIFKGKISSRLQYALWLLVALRLMIPVSAQIYMAVGSINEFRIMDLTRMAESKVGDMTAQLEQPVHFTMSMNGVAGKLAAKYLLETNSDLLGSPDGPTSVFYAGKIGFTWLDILRGIWIGGMAVAALWMIIANIVFARRLHKERKEYVLPEPEENDSPQGKWLSRTGDDKWRKLVHRTKIYMVEGIASPCLYGMPFREAVYLTPDITEDEDRLRHVLTHEICHKMHGDSLWSILRSILLAIYWINPFVWAAAVLSRRDCELACDEEALLILGEEERISYGETLLSIITRKGKLSDIACTATTMTGSGKSIKERIRFIAEKPHVLRAAAAAVIMLVILISVLVFTKSPLFHGQPLEGEAVLTAGDMQITLPETIAYISGYEADGDGDIVIYQISSGEEVGRFCEMSYGEAVLALESGREVIPIGNYGDNLYLKEFMYSFYPTETVTHTYTPSDTTIHNYDAPDDSVNTSGMLYHEEYYVEPDDSGAEGVPGTDSNSDDTTYIIGDESMNPSITVEDGVPIFSEEDIMPGDSYNDGKYYIPAPQKTDWEIIPLSEEELAEEELRNQTSGGVLAHEDMYIPEGEGGAGVPGTDSNSDDTTYIIEDGGLSESQSSESSMDYLPNEEITVTYTPGNITTKCYVYVKGDYSGAKAQYLQELNYINSELEAVANRVVVTESD